jgi:hypothetical protein
VRWAKSAYDKSSLYFTGLLMSLLHRERAGLNLFPQTSTRKLLFETRCPDQRFVRHSLVSLRYFHHSLRFLLVCAVSHSLRHFPFVSNDNLVPSLVFQMGIICPVFGYDIDWWLMRASRQPLIAILISPSKSCDKTDADMWHDQKQTFLYSTFAAFS